MKYKAILFDMDGTLLPMYMEEFTNGYFKYLFAKIRKHGVNPESFASDMWSGVAAMVGNDGSCTNEEAFWSAFEARTGIPKERINGDCLEFYSNEFQVAKQFTGENPLAVNAIKVAREKAEYVILATNPLFPMVAQEVRMGWVGLSPKDFDLVTSYETDRFCKPNPAYFTSICERMGVEPGECLLIGNDEGEDMNAGKLAGLDTYLVTNWMIPNDKHPYEGPRGSFEEMIKMLESL